MRRDATPSLGTLDLHVLGPTELIVGGSAVHLRPAQRKLISILALSRWTSVSADALVDRMWDGEPPRTAHNTLQVHVSAIRRSAPNLIETVGDTYRLSAASTRIDAVEFEQLAAAAAEAQRGGRPDDVLAIGTEALDRWRGVPFSDLIESEFAAADQARLTETMLQLVELRIGALLATGRAESAIPEVEALVIEHPLRERLWELLMLARYRVGRQADALRAFRQVSAILGKQLGVEPSPHLRALEHDILMHAADPGGPVAVNPHNLPRYEGVTIGRSRLLEELVDAVGTNRIVTITGGPGVGKSRLAVELGWTLLADHPGGVHLVRLEGSTTSSDVAASIATVMGVADATDNLAALGRILARRPGVLIIDNVEHLVAPLHELGTSFNHARPELRIVLTSRHKIGIRSEQVFDVPPLAVPAVGADATGVIESEAMQLLLDRARALAPNFPVHDEDLDELASLCRGTGGIPLAIELAGRWLPTLGPGNLNALRTHERHATVGAAIDLSYRLLSDADQQMLVALSVLEAPAGLRSIEGVSVSSMSKAQVAGSVVRLVESSLLTMDGTRPGDIVYSMLMPIRDYASSTPEAEATHDEARIRHATWFASLAESVASELVERIDRVMPDLRTAMRTLIDEGRHDEAAGLAVSLREYWDSRYQTWEAHRWFTEVLVGDLAPQRHLEALWSAGWVAYHNHDYPVALLRYRSCRELAASTGDRLWGARAQLGTGLIGLPSDRLEAERLIESTIPLFVERGSDADHATCLLMLGVSATWRGEARLGSAFIERADALVAASSSSRHRVLSARYRSLAAHLEGRHDDARTLAYTAEAVAREAGDARGVGSALIQRALVDATAGDIAASAGCILEALSQLPDTVRIDHALVFLGAIAVLVEAEELDAARRVFAVIDAIYDEYGWTPIAEINPVAAGYRTRIGASGPVDKPDHVAVRRDLMEVLAALGS